MLVVIDLAPSEYLLYSAVIDSYRSDKGSFTAMYESMIYTTVLQYSRPTQSPCPACQIESPSCL